MKPPRQEPTGAEEKARFTRRRDRFYTTFAGLYEAAVRRGPVWRTWLASTLPHLRGPRVLEVSFGTGWLIRRCAARFEAYGVDLNARMTRIARAGLVRAGLPPRVARARAEALPFPDGVFDSVLNTMALSGYPDAEAALAEMRRVLRPGGRLVLLDVARPRRPTPAARLALAGWRLAGDRIRDVDALLAEAGFEFTAEEVGGLGSVRLFVAAKPAA